MKTPAELLEESLGAASMEEPVELRKEVTFVELEAFARKMHASRNSWKQAAVIWQGAANDWQRQVNAWEKSAHEIGTSFIAYQKRVRIYFYSMCFVAAGAIILCAYVLLTRS